MILFEEALAIISAAGKLLQSERINLENCNGRVLAEDVYSDMDMPPFDKSAVDGYACRRADLAGNLRVLETIPAGKVPGYSIGPGECSKLMTGGMLPVGADTVIMVEDVEITSQDTIKFIADRTSPNFSSRAEDIRKGERVLLSGTLIRPQEVAVLASVGCSNPLVIKQPRVGIISTGDELVEPTEIPGLSQIRNSNACQLVAQAQRANCIAKYFGIARDNEAATLQIIQVAAAESDIVILTGGISAGDFDFVPSVIQQAGFEIRFRSMAVQPGKPVIFATRGNCYLIGLPGNPVSSFVQFELLVKHLVRCITGNKASVMQLKLPAGEYFRRNKSTRKSFLPIRISSEGTVLPIEYHGSAHIQSYIHADGILTIEIGETEIAKGTLINVRLL